MSRQILPKNICKVFPTPQAPPDIDITNFVYEANDFPPEEQLRTTYALCLVISGKGHYVVASKTHPLTRGDIFMIFSTKKFYLHSDDAMTYSYISFTGLQVHNLLHRLRISVLSPVFHGYAMLIPHWQESLQRATQENLDLIALSTFYKTISYLATRDESPQTGSDKKGDELMAQIKRYIDEHFQEQALTLDGIATLFGYHPKYISERFKRAMGQTVTHYLTDCRMHYARALIYEGYTSVTMIADACGYRDPMYFSRVFTKTYGCSPMAMRRGMQKQSGTEYALNNTYGCSPTDAQEDKTIKQ
ncbi:MAG: helix-turn-helix domain-containing protein [Clostridia bacterium]|nr:helix-turn-helix domain-containing protein [Clostridia bacterium]